MSDFCSRHEIHRLFSFLNYPATARVRPPQLSRLGFYYTGIGEEVRCCACGVSHSSFNPDSDIPWEHLKKSPRCQFLLERKPVQVSDADDLEGTTSGRKPVQVSHSGDLERVENIDLNAQNFNHFDNSWIWYTTTSESREIRFNRREPDFSLLDEEGFRLRLHTFYDWPEEFGDREQLARNGLFYTGSSDRVMCCHCGFRFRAVNLARHPEERRAVCLPSCCYAQQERIL